MNKKLDKRLFAVIVLSLCLTTVAEARGGWLESIEALAVPEDTRDADVRPVGEPRGSSSTWPGTIGKLGVTGGYTFMTRLMDKGGEYYGTQSASLFNVNVDLFETGFGAGVSHRRANHSGYVRGERMDYKLWYGNSVLDDTPARTDYKLIACYHQFPRRSRHEANYQEFEIDLRWKKLIPGGLTPYYNGSYESPLSTGQLNRSAGGWFHVMGLAYALELPGVLPDQRAQVVDLNWLIAYRDGLGGGAVDHDWTHTTIEASTKFRIIDGLSFSPGVAYQVSMDDSVTKHDVFYATFKLIFEF